MRRGVAERVTAGEPDRLPIGPAVLALVQLAAVVGVILALVLS